MQLTVWDNSLFYIDGSLPSLAGVLVYNSSFFIIPAGGYSRGGCVGSVCPVPYRYFSFAPVLPGGWRLYGELHKVVPISSTRIKALTASVDALTVVLSGGPDEVVWLALIMPGASTVTTQPCVITSTTREAVLTCTPGKCSC